MSVLRWVVLGAGVVLAGDAAYHYAEDVAGTPVSYAPLPDLQAYIDIDHINAIIYGAIGLVLILFALGFL